MKKYFVVEDLKVANVMRSLLNINYYIFDDADKKRYTFERVEGIEKTYGQAIRILENL